jgi:hypothetical protein
VVLSAAERGRLASIAADRNRPRKHIERAQIAFGPSSTAALYHPFESLH